MSTCLGSLHKIAAAIRGNTYTYQVYASLGTVILWRQKHISGIEVLDFISAVCSWPSPFSLCLSFPRCTMRAVCQSQQYFLQCGVFLSFCGRRPGGLGCGRRDRGECFAASSVSAEGLGGGPPHMVTVSYVWFCGDSIMPEEMNFSSLFCILFAWLDSIPSAWAP